MMEYGIIYSFWKVFYLFMKYDVFRQNADFFKEMELISFNMQLFIKKINSIEQNKIISYFTFDDKSYILLHVLMGPYTHMASHALIHSIMRETSS